MNELKDRNGFYLNHDRLLNLWHNIYPSIKMLQNVNDSDIKTNKNLLIYLFRNELHIKAQICLSYNEINGNNMDNFNKCVDTHLTENMVPQFILNWTQKYYSNIFNEYDKLTKEFKKQIKYAIKNPERYKIFLKQHEFKVFKDTFIKVIHYYIKHKLKPKKDYKTYLERLASMPDSYPLNIINTPSPTKTINILNNNDNINVDNNPKSSNDNRNISSNTNENNPRNSNNINSNNNNNNNNNNSNNNDSNNIVNIVNPSNVQKKTNDDNDIRMNTNVNNGLFKNFIVGQKVTIPMSNGFVDGFVDEIFNDKMTIKTKDSNDAIITMTSPNKVYHTINTDGEPIMYDDETTEDEMDLPNSMKSLSMEMLSIQIY